MTPFEARRWILVAALIPLLLGASLALPAQSSGDQSPVTASAASQAAATPAVAVTPAFPAPTPEELGDSLVSHQRYQAAIATYAKSADMTATLWNKMGIAYQMLFNLRDATRCYRESLKLDPNNPDVLNNLGTVYASQKQYGQADRMYHRALKLRPKSAVILKNLGTDLLTEHKYEKGWAAYQQALAIDPDVFTDRSSPAVENPSNIKERGAMNYYMAAACSRSGNADCALRYLRMALDEGFTTRKKVAADSEFAGLRNNPAFLQLLAEQRN
ncbi:MAG: tetratricopeptide repeat protein [Terracidiphilus sp.]|jgi:Tfp pilus assembly protein PilF